MVIWCLEPCFSLHSLIEPPCMQAGANVPGNLKNVEKLMEHPAFSITNPNACYSLFLSFLRSSVNFHAADGSGYKFIGDSVLKVGGSWKHLQLILLFLNASAQHIPYLSDVRDAALDSISARSLPGRTARARVLISALCKPYVRRWTRSTGKWQPGLCQAAHSQL